MLTDHEFLLWFRSVHGGLCGTRTEPYPGTHPRRARECALAGIVWRPAQSERCRDVGYGSPALSGPDKLGAEYLYAPRPCPPHVLLLLSYTCSEGGLEVIENEAAPATLPLVTASLILGQVCAASHS